MAGNQCSQQSMQPAPTINMAQHGPVQFNQCNSMWPGCAPTHHRGTQAGPCNSFGCCCGVAAGAATAPACMLGFRALGHTLWLWCTQHTMWCKCVTMFIYVGGYWVAALLPPSNVAALLGNSNVAGYCLQAKLLGNQARIAQNARVT